MFSLPLEDHTLWIAGESFHVRAVKDSAELLDHLLELDPHHPDLKDERLPYWAELWPSAIALAEFILSSSELGPEHQVLELGCGSGLAGLAAAKRGAQITLTDYQQPALDLALANFKANQVPPPLRKCMDWRNPDQDLKADILLAADVAYEARFFDPLIHTFEALLNPGGTILLSEPHRELAIDFFELLEKSGFTYIQHDRTAPSGNCVIPIGVYEIYRAP